MEQIQHQQTQVSVREKLATVQSRSVSSFIATASPMVSSATDATAPTAITISRTKSCDRRLYEDALREILMHLGKLQFQYKIINQSRTVDNLQVYIHHHQLTIYFYRKASLLSGLKNRETARSQGRIYLLNVHGRRLPHIM